MFTVMICGRNISAADSSMPPRGGDGRSHMTETPPCRPHEQDSRHDPHGHRPVGVEPHVCHAAKKRKRGWIWPLAAVLAVGGGILAYQASESRPPDTSGGELSQVIRMAAKGVPAAPRKDGVTVRVLSGSGATVVTAEGVAPKICVSAGWNLVKGGTLTVNGLTPLRVSAAKLAELCNAGPTATITWTPEE